LFGTDPKPIPLVRRPNIGSSQHCPPCVIPERGQITEDNSEPPSNESWTVFHEHESGSNFANDARHVGPHTRALSGDSCAFPGNADVLARETSRHHVNSAAPRSSVKGLHVIPNWERREGSIVLSCDKDGLGVRFPLNSTNASMPEQLAAENAASSACE
jgi:hypothetical protein